MAGYRRDGGAGLDGLENLIITYAGLLLLNTALSAMLWWHHRTALFGSLFAVWGTSLVAFGFQGALQEGTLQVVLSFSTVEFIGLALAFLLRELVDVPVPWRLSLVLWASSLVAAVVLDALGASFAVTALPVCIAVSVPLVVAVFAVISRGLWRELTFSGRGLVLSVCAYVAHGFDFPILRPLPEFAALGFTIAILIVFALSIFAPAAVLEMVTERQARISTELELARQIQLGVLPRDPTLPGLELACFMQPAEEVGGDYYDIFSFGDEGWLVLGDVTGHGLSSGLVMLMAQSIISAILQTRPDITPAELNFTANHILHGNLRRMEEQRSMTVVALRTRSDGHAFVYSGSHEDLYIYRSASGEVEVLDVVQMPHGLGMLDEFARDEYTNEHFQLQPGDLLFVSSDGVREAPRNGDYRQGMYGEERLTAFLKRSPGVPLADLRRQLVREVEEFTAGVIHDDISFVMARVGTA